MRREIPLEDLLGSPTKIKLIKFFLQNGDKRATHSEIAMFLKENPSRVKSALRALVKGRLVFTKKQKTGTVYFANKNFYLFRELSALIVKSNPASFEFLKKSLRGMKGIKLAAACGIFLGEDGARADLLVVGDRLNKSLLKKLEERVEASMGREIRLAVFDTNEFEYRMNMYDKFVRDILEYRHEKLVNKLHLD